MNQIAAVIAALGFGGFLYALTLEAWMLGLVFVAVVLVAAFVGARARPAGQAAKMLRWGYLIVFGLILAASLTTAKTTNAFILGTVGFVAALVLVVKLAPARVS